MDVYAVYARVSESMRSKRHNDIEHVDYVRLNAVCWIFAAFFSEPLERVSHDT